MRLTLVLLAVAGASLVAAGYASAHAACTPGSIPGGRRFCGPAKATLNYGGKKYVFNQGGTCTVSGSTWSLNIGTITLTGSKPKYAYFGITVFSRRPGTHSAAVSWQLHGKNLSLSNAKVTVSRGLKKGTFVGSVGGRKGSGSFRCR